MTPLAEPRRIQRRRTKGWRMPPGAIYVGRPTRWGNPFLLHDWRAAFRAVLMGFRGDRRGRTEAAIALYRAWLTAPPTTLADDQSDFWQREVLTIPVAQRRPSPDEIAALRGHDLVCWCPRDQPCHADVLLEIANTPLRCAGV